MNKYVCYKSQLESIVTYGLIGMKDIFSTRNQNLSKLPKMASLNEMASLHAFNRLVALHWRYNGHDGVSNHQPSHDCLLNRLFGRRSKKTSKLRVTGPCAGNSPGTGEFPAQMASNTENVSIWWRHHGAAVQNMIPMCRNSEHYQVIISRFMLSVVVLW